ncbi:FAD-dependent oxidoreductase [uncultured Hydrogenophaga sp.]|uniref:FAD-dependent oxidoreductase n=1 Tax=uncultured Hydrogenophaga sp. TaxID=199683 RepID=UPI00265E91FC|nr:bifunctional TVP38/TMEM64 family protein/FAD-dependent oxidoreductase [uncultured Hydrogenophaga sp.]
MAQASRLRRWGIAAVALLAFGLAYQQLGLGQWLTLDQLKNSRDALVAYYAADPLLTAGIFFGVYVLVTALSLPGAVILTLAGGAVFGLGVGLLIVSFASSLGALLAFWVSRSLLRDLVQARFGKLLAPINAGLAKDGVFYLLTLRLVPVFPFWLINLLMGLTQIGARSFYLVSQVGMLAGTAVYVNAGTQLAAIESTADVVSPGLLGSLALLGVFPLIAKWAVGALQRRKVYARWTRPRRFDRNLVVIGAGAGGLVSAYIGAAVKARVTLIEGHRMGGDCLNYGCVPSKALIRSAKAMKQIRKAASFGLRGAQGEVDFAAVMQRIHGVIRDIEPHDSVERYTGLGVEVLQGHARIVTPWEVEVTLPDGSRQSLTTRSIVIATGASPFVPPIPGLKEAGFLTSDTLWGLTALPRRLVVLGGGPIGSELAQSFARLGSEVTQVEMAPRILVREDPEVSELVAASLRADGVRVLTGHKAVRVDRVDGEKRLIVQHEGQDIAVPFDELLCAVGRSPRVTGYGLEELGIPLTARNTIETNAWLQTLYPNIYAVGDVAGPFQFTHTAAHQAWYAAVNALFGRFKRFKADYSVIPWATFTDPEVARVGLSETEARDQGIPFEVTRYGIDDLDRAIADGTAHGFVKVLTVPGKDRILGVTIVGEHAGDLLAEYVLAMKHGLGLNKILGTIHTYPTLAEANKYAAGEWKRAHAPQRLLAWVERFHAWERS